MELDRVLRERLIVACEASMVRALERAGNKLKGRAGRLRDTLRGVHPTLAAATLGPSLIADAGFTLDELIGDAHVDVASRYRLWAQHTADEASNITGELVGGWSVSAKARLADVQAAHLAESHDFLKNQLDELTRVRIFESSLITSGDLIPTGFARSVLAVAGGTTDLTTTGYAYVALTAHGTQPAPGLATGPDVIDAARGAGAVVEAYRWLYGPAQRGQSFPPHRRLDGKAFLNFDDAVLVNTTGWPPFSHYMPGDHEGCRCDYEPVLLSPQEAAAIGYKPKGDPFGGAQIETDQPLADFVEQQQNEKAKRKPAADEMPSNAVEYTSPKAKKLFGPTIDKLDKIHRVEPGQLPPTQVVAGGKADRKGGHFTPAHRPPQPRRDRTRPLEEHMARLRAWRDAPQLPEIRVNDRGDGGSLISLLHEFGHRLDYIAGPDINRIPRDSARWFYSKVSEQSPAMKALLEALNSSPTISEARQRFHWDTAYIGYFKSNHEMWARAYSQWAANTLGGPERAALEAIQASNPYQQWPDDEFESIMQLITAVLRERGLM